MYIRGYHSYFFILDGTILHCLSWEFLPPKFTATCVLVGKFRQLIFNNRNTKQSVKLIINASERSNDVVLVSSVLTLKMFHTLFSVSIVKFGQELSG